MQAYSLYNVVRMIKSNVRCLGHVERMEETEVNTKFCWEHRKIRNCVHGLEYNGKVVLLKEMEMWQCGVDSSGSG
jgi:hypothetical protein